MSVKFSENEGKFRLNGNSGRLGPEYIFWKTTILTSNCEEMEKNIKCRNMSILIDFFHDKYAFLNALDSFFYIYIL